MIQHSRPWLSEADIAAVVAQLESEMIASGSRSKDFEMAIANALGFGEAIAAGSGCQALALALGACGLGPGKRIAVPTYVCPEVLGTIEHAGAQAVISDVTEEYLLDPNDPAVTASDGIVLPSLFGKRAPEMQVPVPVIDDWAQYLPAAPVHKSPAIAIVSFGGTKPITAGEGGAILVNDPGLAERLRQQKRLTGGASGLNLYPFSDLQAALALSQLGRKDEMALRRRAHADAYAEALADMRGLSFASPASADVPYRLPIRLSDELLARTGGIEALIRKMAKRGIAVRRPVAVLLHHVRPQARPLPVADDLFARTISLPLYPSLVPEQRHAVIVALREVLA